MGLMQRLLDTYEANAGIAGTYQDGKVPLAPVSHDIRPADLTVFLDAGGNFLDAARVTDGGRKTAIPVTEASAGRSSNVAPHPLCEQLGYLGALGKKGKEKQDAYLSQLQAWAEDDPENNTLRAVLAYVKKNSIIRDVRECLEQKSKKKEKLAEKMLVRWVADGSPCWQDAALFQSFIRFYDRTEIQKREKAVCMVTGKTGPPATMFKKSIDPFSANRKLISANDTDGFTYRGRFENETQALTVGYEAAQKSMNALTWLVANYAERVGGRIFLRWGLRPAGLHPAEPHPDSNAGDGGQPRYAFCPDVPSLLKPLLPDGADSLDAYRSQLGQMAAGADRDTLVAVLSLDGCSKGRLAVTSYDEMPLPCYVSRLAAWDKKIWYQGSKRIRTPALVCIAAEAFGLPRNGRIAFPRDGLLKQLVQRLASCRLYGKPVPGDFAWKLAAQCAGILQLEREEKDMDAQKRMERRKLQNVAMAVIRDHMRQNRKGDFMGLDKDNTDRSYLYGRWLAVAEMAEWETYVRWKDGKLVFKNGRPVYKEDLRETNAVRYRRHFVAQPAATMKTLSGKLDPYYSKQFRRDPGRHDAYKALELEIQTKLEAQAPGMMGHAEQALGPTYILGYSQQKRELQLHGPFGKKANKEEKAGGAEGPKATDGGDAAGGNADVAEKADATEAAKAAEAAENAENAGKEEKAEKAGSRRKAAKTARAAKAAKTEKAAKGAKDGKDGRGEKDAQDAAKEEKGRKKKKKE